MGKERFVKGLQEYIRVWNGKHPIPYDFFGMMDQANGESLNWFWNPWFFETAYPDLKISSVRLTGRTLQVEVENTGGLPLPVKLTLKDNGGRVQEVLQSCTCWKGAVKKTVLKLMVKEMPAEVSLGDVSIPDMAPADNVWKP
jgi:aminopeptidase N